jgi:kinesin family protein C1
VCILAYGQTGSGKTFTMEGPNLCQAEGVNEFSGILPRAVDFIFHEIKRLSFQGLNIEIELACVEIYLENLTDLLEKDSGNPLLNSRDKDNKENSKLSISMIGGKVVINKLTWEKITDYAHLLSTVKRASKTRTTEKTNWNERYAHQ